MKDWKKVVVAEETSLGEAIQKVDVSGLQVALVLSKQSKLLGILTDGDFRRAILAGKSLKTPVAEVMSVDCTTASVETSRDEMLLWMREKLLHHLPVVDEIGRLVGLVTLDDLIGATERPNWVVLMAGGLGTRLKPLTDACPKPLLEVGGKPILEIALERFAEQGFKHIFLSVNYKAEMLRNYFGAGERWGLNIHYLHESTRLGTAGSLTLLKQKPMHPVIVMNSDLITHIDFEALLQFHDAQHADATMVVRSYDFQVPYGVVRSDGVNIMAIEEKPVHNFFVNAGVYVLSPDVLDYVPEDAFFDMPDLFQLLIEANKKTVAYPLREYWLDIGRLEEFEKAQLDWGARYEKSGNSILEQNNLTETV
jgi:dTDP-glucose pyrophosphorylase